MAQLTSCRSLVWTAWFAFPLARTYCVGSLEGGRDRGDQPGERLETVSPCTIQKLVHVRRVLGGTAGRRGYRRGGLYLYALAARRFDCLPRGRVGSLGVEERRPPRRQSDDQHFGSLLVVAVTAGAFMLVAWIATKALFVFPPRVSHPLKAEREPCEKIDWLKPSPALTTWQAQTNKQRCGPGCGTSFFPGNNAVRI
jgi:hypothetical protein